MRQITSDPIHYCMSIYSKRFWIHITSSRRLLRWIKVFTFLHLYYPAPKLDSNIYRLAYLFALPLGGSLHRVGRNDTLRDAPHVVAHLGHRRGVPDLQREFDAPSREAEEFAASVLTYRIARA